MGRASEIDRDELNFQKFIHRLRNKFNVLFLNALRVQLILKESSMKIEWYSIVQDLRFDYVSDSCLPKGIPEERELISQAMNRLLVKFITVELKPDL